MDDSRAEFDAHDMKLLDEAHRETEAAEAAASTAEDAADTLASETDPAPAAAPAEAPAPAAPAEAPAPAPSAAPDAAVSKTQAAPDAQGNTKAALRAARHEAKRLRDEVETLRKQIGSGAAKTADPNEPAEPDESQLNDVREYAPAVGKDYDRLKAELAELKTRLPAREEPAAFVPKVFPDDVQAAIDEVPELLLWHSAAEHQDKLEAATAADMLLEKSPKWQGRPLAERFAAAVKMVIEQGVAPSKASTAKTLEDAQRVIAAAASAPAGPVSLGDLRGGATAATSSSLDPHQMVKDGKSDEDIMAALPVMP